MAIFSKENFLQLLKKYIFSDIVIDEKNMKTLKIVDLGISSFEYVTLIVDIESYFDIMLNNPNIYNIELTVN